MMLRPKELEKIRKKISVENDELDCLTAMCYMGTGKYSKANSMLEKIGKRRNGQLPICVFLYRRAMKQQETDTMEEEKMKKRAKKIVALFLTAGILLSGTAACSNVEGMHLSGSTRELNVTKEDTGKSGDNVQMLPSDEKSDKIFADSYADFAIKAFQNSYEAGKNTMISPYSVINALAMTANGASGETLEQMESVLCGTADCSLDLLNRELQRLQSSMPKEKNNHLYTANSIWYKDSDENFVPAPLEHKEVFGVTFEQGRQELEIDDAMLSNIVTENKELTEEAKRDMKISLIILKYTQSNSVCFVKDGQAIGVGAGQQSRVHCTRLAGQKADNWFLRQCPKVLNLPFKDTISRAERDNAIDVYIGDEYMDVLADGMWEKTFTEKPEVFTKEEKRAWLDQMTDVTLGSDAFFPFSDNIERAHKSGVKYIAQPGGSVRDDAVIETCNKYGMVMSFTGIRLFHH